MMECELTVLVVRCMYMQDEAGAGGTISSACYCKDNLELIHPCRIEATRSNVSKLIVKPVSKFRLSSTLTELSALVIVFYSSRAD